MWKPKAKAEAAPHWLKRFCVDPLAEAKPGFAAAAKQLLRPPKGDCQQQWPITYATDLVMLVAMRDGGLRAEEDTRPDDWQPVMNLLSAEPKPGDRKGVQRLELYRVCGPHVSGEAPVPINYDRSDVSPWWPRPRTRIVKAYGCYYDVSRLAELNPLFPPGWGFVAQDSGSRLWVWCGDVFTVIQAMTDDANVATACVGEWQP